MHAQVPLIRKIIILGKYDKQQVILKTYFYSSKCYKQQEMKCIFLIKPNPVQELAFRQSQERKKGEKKIVSAGSLKDLYAYID